MIEECNDGRKVSVILSPITDFCPNAKNDRCMEASCSEEGECVYSKIAAPGSDRCKNYTCDSQTGTWNIVDKCDDGLVCTENHCNNGQCTFTEVNCTAKLMADPNTPEKVKNAMNCYIFECSESKSCTYRAVDGWEEMIQQENQCYEVVCENNKAVLKMRENASSWENQTTDCVEFSCENASGVKVMNKCGENMVCMNDTCVEKEKMTTGEERVVEIVFDEQSATWENFAVLVEAICKKNNLDPNSVKAGYERDSEGNVNRAFIITENENAADIIAEAINTECANNTSWRIKTATVVPKGTNVSPEESCHIRETMYLVVISVMVSLISILL